MITVEVNGVVYTGFTDINLFNSIEDATGFFNLQVTQNLALSRSFPIKAQDEITLYVDNVPRLNGYVDAVSVSYDARSHRISVKGRDKTCDIIDSTLGVGINFSAPITLEQVTKTVLNSLGIKNVNVLTNTTIQPFSASELVSAEVGQSAFDFIESYCRKRQVLFTTDGNGNVLFVKSSMEPIKTSLINVINGNENNIKSASTNVDFVTRFAKYISHSQGNNSALVGDNSSQNSGESDITGYQGLASDSLVRSTRQMNFIAESSSNVSECINRSIWQANWQRTKSFVYNATVVGHSTFSDGFPWRPNLLINVIDDFCDIEAQLLISKVTFMYSVSNGSTTDIECVTRDAYTLQAEQDQKKATTKLNKESKEYTGIFLP